MDAKMQKIADEYIDRYTETLFSGKSNEFFNPVATEDYIRWVYGYCELELPTVVVAENLWEANYIANCLNQACPSIVQEIFDLNNKKKLNNGQKESLANKKEEFQIYCDSLLTEMPIKIEELEELTECSFLVSVYMRAYLAWARLYTKELNETLEAPLDLIEDLYMKSNFFSGIHRKGYCIVSKCPTKISTNEERTLLHSTEGSAITWRAGITGNVSEHFYIKGREVNGDVFKAVKAGTYTFNDWLKEPNTETKGHVFELIEPSEFIKFSNMVMVDECTIEHKNGEVENIELFETQDVIPEVDCKIKVATFVCPSTGMKFYIPAHPDSTGALDAAKRARPDFVPKDMDYTFNARS